MTGKELKESLRSGKRVYGTLIVSTSPKWVDIIAQLNLDFVFIDTEHIAIDRHQLSWMCHGYMGKGLVPVVRIPSPDPYQACMALDGGAKGLVAPYIESVDEVRLLRDILAATIQVQLREKDRTESATRTIGQILEGWTPYVPNAEQRLVPELEARGVRIVQLRDGAGSSLFLVPEMVREKLLHGSRWQQTRIDQILKRLPGAQSIQQRCAGQRPWGISLPWPCCLESIDGEDNGQDDATL